MMIILVETIILASTGTLLTGKLPNSNAGRSGEETSPDRP